MKIIERIRAQFGKRSPKAQWTGYFISLAVLVIIIMAQCSQQQLARQLRPKDDTPDTPEDFLKVFQYASIHLAGLDCDYAETESFLIGIFINAKGEGGHCVVGQATPDGFDFCNRYCWNASNAEFIQHLSVYKNEFLETTLVLVGPMFGSLLTAEQRDHASHMQVVDENGKVYQKFKLGDTSVFFMEYEANPSGLEIFVEFLSGTLPRESVGVIDDKNMLEF